MMIHVCPRLLNMITDFVFVALLSSGLRGFKRHRSYIIIIVIIIIIIIIIIIATGLIPFICVSVQMLSLLQSSICPGRLSTAWLGPLVVFSCVKITSAYYLLCVCVWLHQRQHVACSLVLNNTY